MIGFTSYLPQWKYLRWRLLVERLNQTTKKASTGALHHCDNTLDVPCAKPTSMAPELPYHLLLRTSQARRLGLHSELFITCSYRGRERGDSPSFAFDLATPSHLCHLQTTPNVMKHSRRSGYLSDELLCDSSRVSRTTRNLIRPQHHCSIPVAKQKSRTLRRPSVTTDKNTLEKEDISGSLSHISTCCILRLVKLVPTPSHSIAQRFLGFTPTFGAELSKRQHRSRDFYVLTNWRRVVGHNNSSYSTDFCWTIHIFLGSREHGRRTENLGL